MKNILIIIFLCASGIVNAQSTLCPSLNLFVGEWRYVNGQDTIRIYLRSHDCLSITPDGSSTTISSLWGWHEYKKGNTIIESNYANRLMNLPANYDNIVIHSSSVFLLMPQCDLSKYRLIGYIEDISQCNEMKVITAQFNIALNQITWHQTHGEGFGVFSGCKGMTLPRDFLLTKQ